MIGIALGSEQPLRHHARTQQNTLKVWRSVFASQSPVCENNSYLICVTNLPQS